MITIKITIDPTSDTPQDEQMTNAMAALGFKRTTSLSDQDIWAMNAMAVRAESRAARAALQAEEREAALAKGRPEPSNTPQPAGEDQATPGAPQVEPLSDPHVTWEGYTLEQMFEYLKQAGREHGKAPAGRIRRTKAEIAEDDYISSLQPKQEKPKTVPPEQVTPLLSEPVQQAVADIQDEQAEAENPSTPDVLTRDDVRHAVGRYSVRHGVAAAVRDIPGIIGCAIIDIPNDPAAFVRAIGAIDKAIKSPPVAPSAAPPSLQDVKDVGLEYARRFDGTTDRDKLVHTGPDLTVLLKEVVGPAAKSLMDIPEDKRAEFITAVRGAISANRFEREVRNVG